MELMEYFTIIKKRILMVILITIGATVLSGVLSYFVITPTYKADISVIIGKIESKSEVPRADINDVLMYQNWLRPIVSLLNQEKFLKMSFKH